MYDATNASPEGGKDYPKIGVTPEFMDSYRKLKEFFVRKYGEKGAIVRMYALAKHFQEMMNDHQLVDRLVSGSFGFGDLLKDANFRS